ncbi:dimethylaniline monooxygenase [N-oxide-forming], partial [Elysia marginata]
IEFEDGTFEDNIDLVVFATGYKVGYSFLDKSVLGEIQNNRLELYKHMWVLDLAHPTLAILGSVQPLGAMFPIAELQARLAARVFKQKNPPASSSVRWVVQQKIPATESKLRDNTVDSCAMGPLRRTKPITEEIQDG